jgi:PAS domain S-box-containing protein
MAKKKTTIEFISEIASEYDNKFFAKMVLDFCSERYQCSKLAFISTISEKMTVEAMYNKSASYFHIKEDLSEYQGLPDLPAQIVLREKKAIFLNKEEDIQANVNETYLRQNNIKSIAVLPLALKGATAAIIYLENATSETALMPKELEQLIEIQAPLASFYNNIMSQVIKNEIIAEKEKDYLQLIDSNQQLQMKIDQVNDQMRRLNVVIRETGNVIMTFDADYKLEWVNSSFLNILGYSKNEYIETFGPKITDISNNPRIKEIIAECVTHKKSISYDTYTYNKQGHKVWMHRTVTPIFDNKLELDKLMTIDTDITQMKKAQDEVLKQKEELRMQRNTAIAERDELTSEKKYIEKAFKKNSNQSVKVQAMLMELNDKNDELALAQQAANDASREKSQFLANMSHEIRTPMNGIIGMASLISRTELAADQAEWLRLLLDSANGLLEIINDILDISKIESGKVELEPHAFSLRDLVSGVVKNLEFKAEEKLIYITEQIDSKLPDYFVGDSTRIKQIIINLANNSLKFTEKGGVTIRVSQAENLGDSVALRLEVEDTGIGIKQENIGRIFDKFMQADLTTTRKYGGTGLGLCISQELVQLMGGQMQVKSTYGQGSVFFFEIILPIASKEAIDHLLLEQSAGAAKADIKFADGIKILVAEDNKTNQTYIKSLLKIYGAEPVIVNNGAEAIAELEKNHYHCVLMDLHMPVMNGLEAAAAIRRHHDSKIKSVPIIALTAAAYKEDQDRAAEAGMDDFITKPVNERKLISAFTAANPAWLKITAAANIYNEPDSGTKPAPKAKEEAKNQPPVIDTVAFSNNFGGFSQEVITEIVQQFLEKLPEQLRKIEDYADTADYKKLRSAAHSLKGEMATFCAVKAEKSLQIIEDKAERSDGAEIMHCVAAAKKASEEAAGQISIIAKI